jgi:O-antigen ligase
MATLAQSRWPTFVAALLGLAIAVALTKLGNPVIFDAMSVAPENFAEFIFAFTWPMRWGYAVVIPVLLVSLTLICFKAAGPNRIFLLVLAWLFLVFLSSARSVAPELSRLAVTHFAVAVAFFCVGHFVLGPMQKQNAFWRIAFLGFLYTLWIGLEQHNGGLQATREAFYQQPEWQKASKELILRMESNRVFSIFIYANAFAGAILLWTPALIVILWDWTKRFPSVAQKVVVGLFGYMAVACLFWTGSKAGWLIALALAAAALLHLPMSRRLRIGIISGILALGLAGFAVKNLSYFKKGATSASARLIYWKAAVQVANDHPLLGAGPGTFAKTFAPIKPPEAEMARLTHNDYLEQACDSGWPAFLIFGAFVAASLYFGHSVVTKSPLHLAVWLGALGWALQSLVEFGLYIPAIAWSAFLFLGWLLGSRNPIDTLKASK